MDSLRKVRTFAAGAQSEMRSQLGPELDELRRQIAELQSLKEIKELRELRDLDPRRMVGKGLLGEEFSGGIKGFLGLAGEGPDAAAAAAAGAATTGAVAASPAIAASATDAPSGAGDTAETPAASGNASAPQASGAGQWGDVT
jgi:sec-independent protein translocase protein TatB